jgi:hypothetical protein
VARDWTPNATGHAETLVPFERGNRAAEKHGFYSARRELSPEAAEIAKAILELPHVAEADALAAREAAKLVVLIDRVDEQLAGGLIGQKGRPRELLVIRDRLSGRLGQWLDRLGLSPASRASWVAALGRRTFAEELRERLEAER